MERVAAPAYDRFKSIVTLILIIILILMLLRGCAVTPPAAAVIPTNTAVPVDTAPADTQEPAGSPVPEQPTVTSTAPPVEPTSVPTESTPSPTTEPTVSPTPDTPVTPGPTEAAPSDTTACATSAPSRLSVGQQARVLTRLNMRQEPSIQAAILKTNPTGTQVEVIGGPVCTPVQNSAYLWWQIRLADGSEGWSAESPLNQNSYFLEPLP